MCSFDLLQLLLVLLGDQLGIVLILLLQVEDDSLLLENMVGL